VHCCTNRSCVTPAPTGSTTGLPLSFFRLVRSPAKGIASFDDCRNLGRVEVASIDVELHGLAVGVVPVINAIGRLHLGHFTGPIPIAPVNDPAVGVHHDREIRVVAVLSDGLNEAVELLAAAIARVKAAGLDQEKEKL